MKREKHFRTVRPYLAMLVALAMVLTSFATPSVTRADDTVQTEETEAETTETVENSEEAEAETEESAIEETAEETEDAEETSEQEEPEITETEWTVYVYFCGSDLESAGGCASDNLKSILKIPKNDQVRFVIEAGGAEDWQNEKIDAERCQRFLIQGDEMTLVYDEPMRDMADPGNLSDFIKWGKENYPSKKSMFIFWNHGGGISGVCVDELYGDSLSIPDLTSELEKSGAHFDIIGFDACLMAEFDVLYALSPYADYFVASQEVEPGCGWDYKGFGTYLSENPECSPKQLGTEICDSYIDNLTNTGSNSTSTLAVIESEGLEDVKTAIDDMMAAVNEKITDEAALTSILALAYVSKHYYRATDKDLVDLAKELAYEIGEEFYYEIKEAVQGAVIYRAQMDESLYNNGISLFWAPISDISSVTTYGEFAASDEYLRFIDAINYSWHGSSELYEGHDRLETIDPDTYKLEYETKSGYAAVDPLVITNALELVSSITYEIGSETEDGYIIEIARKGNLDIKSGNTFTPVFDGKIATIEGNPIVMSVAAESEEYTLYNVPVYIRVSEDSDIRVLLRVAFYPDKNDNDKPADRWVGDYGNEENGTFKILGVYNDGSSASDFAERDIIQLVNGMQITIAYPQKNDKGIVFYRKGETFTYSPQTSIEMTALSDGKYYISYNIETTFGKTFSTEPQPVEVKKGVLTRAKEAVWTAKTSKDKKELIHIPCLSKDKFYDKKDSDSESDNEADAKITVLMYMDGADLEASGDSTGLIQSMMKAKESEDVNFIMETGGCDEWQNDAVKGGTIQRFEVHEGTLVEVETLPNDNFATEHTFEEFLKWGVTNYPAEKYILMMFDHGGAWTGNSVDVKYDNSMISLDEITEAVKNSGVHYDLLYFNCCLMATAEVCAALAPYSDYMIGSEESIYVRPEMDQSEAFSYIVRHANDFDTKKYGKYVVDDIISGLEDSMTGSALYDYQQMSLIDLSKMDRVVSAVNSMGNAMLELEDKPYELSLLLLSLDETRNFAYEFQRDIADLAGHAAGVDSKVVNEVINAVDDAVVLSRATNDYTRSCGMTMCYPVGNKGLMNLYAEVCPFKDYLAFVDSVTLGWHAYPGTYEEGKLVNNVNPLDYKTDYEIVSQDEKTAVLKVNSEIYTASYIYYTVSKAESDGYRFTDICKMGNVMYSNEDGNVFIPAFDGRVITIDGISCYASVYQEEEDRIVYAIPAKISGENIRLLVECVPDENSPDNEAIGYFELDECSYYILGAVLDRDLHSGIVDRDVIRLDLGDEITLLQYESDAGGNRIYEIEGETITYSDNLSVKIVNLEDGEYRLNFEILDGLMNTVRSEDVKVIIKSGRIQQEIVPEKENEEDASEEEDVAEEEIIEEESSEEEQPAEEPAEEEEEPADDESVIEEVKEEQKEIDTELLKYNSDSEDASKVYFMQGVTLDEAKALSEEGMKVLSFETDRNLGFYGAVAANCIDFEEMFEDYADELADDEDEEDDEDDEDEDDDDDDEEEDTDDENVAYVNVIDGVGMVISADPVALDQACLDIISQFEEGSGFLYNVMECHGIDLLEQAEKAGCGFRHYRLEFIDRTAE